MGEEVVSNGTSLSSDDREGGLKKHKKKDKKSKKERKKNREIEQDQDIVQDSLEEYGLKRKEASEEKRKKKKKKRKDSDVASDNDNEVEADEAPPAKENTSPSSSNDNEVVDKADEKAAERAERKRKREEKKQKKKDIMASIPKQDEHGISYTKQQIRRMVRRVQRGLPPVPTPEEEAELKRQDAEMRKEEEMELAGMIYKRDDDNDKQEEEEDEADEPEKEDGNSSEEEGNDEVDENPDQAEDENDKGDKDIQTNPSKKRKLSKKPVPPDYVCQACKNKHNFPHWIYDCPDKVTVRGTNQVAAGRQHGNNAPSAKKVFVSGLFFNTNPKDVKAIFESCGKVTSCKLLKFPDTGRCKGQAFVVFATEESAKKALELSGTKISASGYSGKSNKKDEASSSKRELELKVTKVMSRSFTKGKH